MPSGEYDGSDRDYYFQVGAELPRARRKDRRWLDRNVGTFLRQYARKAQRGKEPNDRRYDRRAEADVKRLRPEELDRLIHARCEDHDDEMSK
jgi:hypothetical protein